ncbi:MAG: squalene/phytoene synthase family protein [Litoreibacter sp.]|nr:squalene/phytoene synthase family protein [Litoreibacter sp.]
MSLEACAALVETADPDRHAVTVLAPGKAQQVLWPLYAFNVEVSRAPWVTQEPMIAEMRLQWWRDALDEIAEGKPVRTHEVTLPLAHILDREGALRLGDLVEARRWDIYAEPFADRAAFDTYIDATYGTLVWTAARLLGADDEGLIRELAYADGVAAMLRATPELIARGRHPLPDTSAAGVAQLAETALSRRREVLARRVDIAAGARPALMAGWRSSAILGQACRAPQDILVEGVRQSEFARRWSLLKAGVFGKLG